MKSLTDREPALGGERRITGPGVTYREARRKLVEGDREETMRLLREVIAADPNHVEALDLLAMMEEVEEEREQSSQDVMTGFGLLGILVAMLIGPAIWLKISGVPLLIASVAGLVTALIPGLIVVLGLVLMYTIVDMVKRGDESPGCIWMVFIPSIGFMGGTLYLTWWLLTRLIGLFA